MSLMSKWVVVGNIIKVGNFARQTDKTGDVAFFSHQSNNNNNNNNNNENNNTLGTYRTTCMCSVLCTYRLPN